MRTLPWDVARSAGLVSWALLAAAVVWGLALSTRVAGPRHRPAWLLDLHRYLGGLATIFTGVHVVAVVADGWVPIGLRQVLVPWTSTWRPGAVTAGVVTLHLLLAVELTSLARRRLPRRLWRTLHLASFPLFVTATVHALTAGTDATAPLVRSAVGGVAALVAGLVVLRLVQTGERALT